MVKFLPLDFLGVSHRIPWRNKNVIDRFQISALVPEIFKFEKCVKYANEMADDVIQPHSQGLFPAREKTLGMRLDVIHSTQ